MQIVHGLPQPINEQPTILTIGTFDGVHLGHQHLIGSAHQRAKALGYQSAALTFDPHPDLVIRPTRQRLYLTSLEERVELMGAIGVDLVIVMPFTPTVMVMTAQQFVAQLCGALALRELWIGWDFAMGRKREGNSARLRELGHEYGFSVHPVEPLLRDGSAVSSSRIRASLEVGDVTTATALLGRPFGMRGVVEHGDKRGRTIGFPTANVRIDPLHMLPANGIYVCTAAVGGKHYNAVTSIGVRPTFDGTHRTVEAYILDFTDEIYGEILQLEFLHWLRNEQKFNSITELIDQINRDTSTARAWLAETKQHS